VASLYRRLSDVTLAVDPVQIPYSPSFLTVGPLSLPVSLGARGAR
jgi:hypothetical protein